MLYNFFMFLFSLEWCIYFWCESSVYLYTFLTIRCCLDLYTSTFFSLLLVISLIVSLWGYYYIDRETRFNQFFLLLGAFIISMAMLIFFSNLFFALIGWDGLGVTSFLLVIYYKSRNALGSGMVTALTNRIGDCLFFCMLGFYALQNHIITLALLILMRITKSAQVPFSSWLPSAMAAPTPVSALVHSSTLVTAGVYLLIRYSNHDSSFLLVIGSCTTLIAGLCACAESDLKKVVALRTLSQLGVMIVALAAFEKTYCFFHLLSHACFKALLFICVGVAIHSMFGTQDFRRFKIIDSSSIITQFIALANLSLIGLPYTSGFYRKDRILELLELRGIAWAVIIFLLGIGLTTCYSLKLLVGTIVQRSFAQGSASVLGGYSWPVKIPLYVLGLLRVIFGSQMRCFCGPLMVSIPFSAKVIPLIILIFGATAGAVLPRLISPLIRSIYILTPITRLLSHGRVTIVPLIKEGEYGWVQGCSIVGISFSSVLSHYSPLIGVGLRALTLFLFL